MTLEQTERWLERALVTEREIEILNEAKNAALAKCTPGASLSGTPGASGFDRNDGRLLKYVRTAQRLEDAIKQLEDMREEILETLLRVPDVHLQSLLIDRYLNEKTWEEIAEDVGKDVRSVYRMKSKALTLVQKCIA